MHHESVEEVKEERDQLRAEVERLKNRDMDCTEALFRERIAEAQLAKAKAALMGLFIESAGMLSAHELVIRSDSGHTNFECYKAKLDMARQTIVDLDRGEK